MGRFVPRFICRRRRVGARQTKIDRGVRGKKAKKRRFLAVIMKIPRAICTILISILIRRIGCGKEAKIRRRGAPADGGEGGKYGGSVCSDFGKSQL